MLMMPRNNFGMNLWDNLFSDPFFKERGQINYMKTDIKEQDQNYVMNIDLPGYDKNDIKAELADGYLKVVAEKKDEVNESNDEGNYIHRERFCGSCERSFYVGENLKEEDIKAAFENGTLKLTFPKEVPAQIEEKKYIAIE